MRVISVVASKGGVGKTCIAAALAVAAAAAHPGTIVGIVDADPQGSLTAWWNWRRDTAPQMYSLNGLRLTQVADSLRQEALDYLLIDTPPGLSMVQRDAIAAADAVLIPCQPSAIDLAAIEAAEMAVAEAGVPSACILNRAVFRTRLAGQAVRAIRDSGRRLLPVLHQRVDIAEAMSKGLTPLETNGSGAAAVELRALWRGVEEMLHWSCGPAISLPDRVLA